MGASSSRENESAALEFIDRVTSEHQVTIFSKSYCPYCDLAKDVMHRAGVQPYVVELNQKDDFPSGSDIQSALAAKTGQRTVPNVFLGKESVGGGTDVEAFFVSGKLKDMLRAVGALE